MAYMLFPVVLCPNYQKGTRDLFLQQPSRPPTQAERMEQNELCPAVALTATRGQQAPTGSLPKG